MIGEPMFPEDPLGLTSAQQVYDELIERGRSPEVAQRNAERLIGRFAPSTLRKLTGELTEWVRFCTDRFMEPFPADPYALIEYLDAWTMTRIAEGRPLQAGTLSSFRNAITRLHEVRGLPDPFVTSTLLGDWIRGYNREHERLPVQAHAVRIHELARMVDALATPDSARLTDEVLVNVVLAPLSRAPLGDNGADSVEEYLGVKRAIRLDWDGVELPTAESRHDTILTIAKADPTRNPDTLILANETGRHLAHQADSGTIQAEIPLSVRMDGTAAMRRLRMRLRQEHPEGEFPTGPVFVNDKGERISNRGLQKQIDTLARRTGLKPKTGETRYTFDERLAMIEALHDPDLKAIRDIALVLTMWWGSLRRCEAANLTIGDIRPQREGRGLYIHIRKQKGNPTPQLRPVPWHRKQDGTPYLTCAPTAWFRYVAAYEKALGRPLQGTDPAFPSLGRGKWSALSSDGVGDAVTAAMAFADLKAQPGERLSSHGLRAGYATENLMQGMPSEVVAQRQGRKSTESLQAYIRLTDHFENIIKMDALTATELEAMFDPTQWITGTTTTATTNPTVESGAYRKKRRKR